VRVEVAVQVTSNVHEDVPYRRVAQAVPEAIAATAAAAGAAAEALLVAATLAGPTVQYTMNLIRQ
jgi:hypothetical protein